MNATLPNDTRITALFAQERQRQAALTDAIQLCETAERELDQLKAQIPTWTRMLPLLGKDAKGKLSTTQTLLAARQREQACAQQALEEVQQHLDQLMQQKMRGENDPELVQTDGMHQLFREAERDISEFNKRVTHFRKSLGETRGAMSAGYDGTHKCYSTAAKDRMDCALKSAQSLDAALNRINHLSHELASRVRGTQFRGINIPRFDEVNYTNFVRRTVKLPIGEAQLAFERMLKACEQLGDEGIGLAFQQLESAREEHQTITHGIIRKHWKTLQHQWQNENNQPKRS